MSTSNNVDDQVMAMLHDHVPLALLCDLTDRDVPHSAEILAAEGQPAEHWWEPAPTS